VRVKGGKEGDLEDVEDTIFDSELEVLGERDQTSVISIRAETWVASFSFSSCLMYRIRSS
jgi:hypothetical protein